MEAEDPHVEPKDEVEDPTGTDEDVEEENKEVESVAGDDLHQNLSAKWEDSFARLLKYREEHGHTLVSRRD